MMLANPGGKLHAKPTVLQGIRRQVRNIRALLLRDMAMRYGRENVGFLWSVIEPMILTVGVMIVWSLSASSKNGVRLIEMVLTGYMPLTLWRHMTNNVVGLFRASSPLLYHRHVTLLDIVVSRQVLEFSGTTIALILVWASLYSFGVVSAIEEPPLFILGWLMMAALGLASGAIIAAVTETSDTAERLIQPIQYLNIPLSGTFFLVDWLPYWAQKAILLHPLVHCYEAFRAGYFGSTIVAHFSVPYFLGCTFVLMFFALVALRAVRDRVRAS